MPRSHLSFQEFLEMIRWQIQNRSFGSFRNSPGLPVESNTVPRNAQFGISVKLFQILKDDAVKVLHSICQCRRCKRNRFDPWDRKIPGGSHGNPLQYSCLENPRDRGAWWPAISGVTQSQTQLKRLSSSSNTTF